MSCDWVQRALERHDPLADLSDVVVEHIDACDDCRAALDARFPPAVQQAPAPKAAPSGSPWGPPAVMVLGVAAAVLLQVGTHPPPSADTLIAMHDASQICVVVWEPPECDEDVW